MVVGDDAQSIYRFRGATVENIRSFSSARTWTLEHNYRSTQQVLDVANEVLAHASQSFRKVLRSDQAEGPMPWLVRARDKRHQAESVAESVLDRRRRGASLRSMAVLFRSNFHANLLEVELVRRKVPYRKFGGLRFTETAHVRDVVAVLKIAS